MKLHRFFGEIILFFSILVAFLLPPIFSQNQNFNSQFEWNFPLNQLLLGVFAFFVFIFEQKNSNNYSFTNNSKKFFTKKNIIITAITFLSLCFIVFFLETIAFFLKSNNPQISGAPLDKKIKIFFCLLNFIFSAFFEEVIYRLYLPQQLKRFFSNIQNEKIKKYIPELITIILFALAHKYLGIYAMINAFFACIVLRICYIKTQNIITNTIAHFLYNITSLIILLI